MIPSTLSDRISLGLPDGARPLPTEDPDHALWALPGPALLALKVWPAGPDGAVADVRDEAVRFGVAALEAPPDDHRVLAADYLEDVELAVTTAIVRRALVDTALVPVSDLVCALTFSRPAPEGETEDQPAEAPAWFLEVARSLRAA